MKYLIDEGTYMILRQRLRQVLTPDANSIDGEYRVTSLYFDDAFRTAYNDKAGGMQTRKKFRIRCYNLDDSRITLECKHKDSEFVSKRNAILTKEQYYTILKGDYDFIGKYLAQEDTWEQFAETSLEELYLSNILTHVKPSVLVDYFREAYVSPFGNVRFTFDRKLSTCYNTLDMLDKNARFSPALDKRTILEVKYDDYLPSAVNAVLSGLPLLQQSVSKFVICTDKLLEVKAHV